MRILLLTVLITCFGLFAYNFRPQNANQANGNQDGSPFRIDGQLVFVKDGTGSLITMIRIEIAENDAERTQGLMWRRYMSEDTGMLFIFDKQEMLSFWMKNTYIPLDIIFADKTGKILSIYKDAAPLNEATIPSGKPCKFVVEVNGGFC